ncbi:electron transfer flavoprotein subunit beta/FixA family protein [Sciscionella sediminilitoris]|uniref:electron transfer flavoprotein subunit beta/FixA family protein n=1 Tax=Sciscionella sediminilitoris TaxID=1445613 RepID=UPI0004DFC253|nr:electron transfer flavoprotein subunit beta/FixA family protein [Sciscionella sp. SE31]
MDVLVCVKRVPAFGAEVVLTEDGELDTRHLGFTIGPHEECAVEEAVRIAERTSGSAGVLTVGPPEAEEQLRYAMAMGADHGVLVEGAGEDPQATASAILAALREIGPYDLLLFGNESADACQYQVGARVANGLGLPVLAGVKGIELGPEEVTLRRDVPDGVEVYRAPLPAVAAVAEGLNLPRYPSIKGRLRAKKAPLHRISPEVAAGGLRALRLRTPPGIGTETKVLGSGAEAADAVLSVLEDLGVLR